MTHKPKITLATLHQASAQEVFDQVVKHMIQQGEKSMDDDGCLYRYKDGDKALKCAAGCLIGDDEYKPTMEENSWANLVRKDEVPDAHAELIEKLQNIHDYEDPIQWEKMLQRLAHLEGLEYNSLP